MRILPVLSVLFLLAGCASTSMNEAECLTGDWRAIGYEDGAAGKSPQYFGVRRKACAEHGVTADFDAYMAGREQGLAHYCDPSNAYEQGARGVRYSGVCPAEAEDAFLAAHGKGYALYERRATVEHARKKLENARNRADEVERDLADKMARMIKPEVSVTERTKLAVDIKQLTDEKVRLGSEIHELEAEYDRARRAYEEYKRHTGSRAY